MSSRSRRLLQINCGCGPHNPAFGQGPQGGIIDPLAIPGVFFSTAPPGWPRSSNQGMKSLAGNQPGNGSRPTFQGVLSSHFGIMINESFQGDTHGYDDD